MKHHSALAVYVVEQYLPRADKTAAEAFVTALSPAAGTDAALTSYLCSLLIQDDDLCLHVFTATSSKRAAAIAQDVGITPERVMAGTTWLNHRTKGRC